MDRTPWSTATRGAPPYRNKDGLPRGFGARSMQGCRHSLQPFDGDSRSLLGRDTQQGMIQILREPPRRLVLPRENAAGRSLQDYY
jgi:hypothetical protein